MSRRGHAYTPMRTHVAETQIAQAYDGPTFDGPVAVEIDYYPDRQVITIRDLPGRTSPLRGDVDNMAKLSLDALQNAQAFGNDKQVMSLWVEKHGRDS